MGYGLDISTTKYKASNSGESYAVSDDMDDGYTAGGDGDVYAISSETDDGYGVADVVTNWILRDGTWRDLGIWIDNEIWKDG